MICQKTPKNRGVKKGQKSSKIGVCQKVSKNAFLKVSKKGQKHEKKLRPKSRLLGGYKNDNFQCCKNQLLIGEKVFLGIN